MKRFWDKAEAVRDGDGWGVRLDGRPVRLPGGAPLLVPGAAVAEAVAEEWGRAGGAKGGEMSWTDVPLTRLAGTAQERIGPNPEPVALELARYAESDLLCYRADTPPALVARQAELWQPWLDWAAARHGAPLLVTEGIVHVAQPAASLAALASAVARLSPLALAALGVAVPALGSLVLGLALHEGALDGAGAHDLATIDERFQEEMWGRDSEAEKRRANLREDVVLAGRLLDLLRG